MTFNREIGMKTEPLVSDRLTVIFQIIIIYTSFLTAITESVPRYQQAKKRQFYDNYLKNRQNAVAGNQKSYKSFEGNANDAEEYDKPLTYRDFIRNEYGNADSESKYRSRNDAYFSRKNLIAKVSERSYGPSKGMKTILSFPFKKSDRDSGINGFEPGDPPADCLAGGVDAGVVDGALKIGIGLGLAPGCGTSTQHTPRMVPVPVIVPRPIPVPVGVPQPYPVAIDIPRPVAIRVPLPIPFPAMNIGPLPIMGSMQQLSSRMMTGACLFQKCIIPPGATGAGIENQMDIENELAMEGNKYEDNTIITQPEAI